MRFARGYCPPLSAGPPMIFSPNQSTNYQDLLRAVGRLLDKQGFRHFRLIESDDGLILQVMSGSRRFEFETYLLTREDVIALIKDSYQLRNHGHPGEAR